MLANLIKKYLIKELKCWGIKFEYELPPEIIISKHAEEKLRERFKCNDAKLKKVVMKAWLSDLPVSDRFKRKGFEELKVGNWISYKSFNGFIFIFSLRFNKYLGATQKTLITVYDYKRNDPIL